MENPAPEPPLRRSWLGAALPPLVVLALLLTADAQRRKLLFGEPPRAAPSARPADASGGPLPVELAAAELDRARRAAAIWRFGEAQAALDALREGADPEAAKVAEALQAQLERWVKLRRRLVAGLERGAYGRVRFSLPAQPGYRAQVDRADAGGVSCYMQPTRAEPPDGKPRVPHQRYLTWMELPPRKLRALLQQVCETTDERLDAAALLASGDRRLEAERLLAHAYEQGGRADRGRVEQAVADLRGELVPRRGYVLVGDQLLELEAAREARDGKVRYRDRWVTQAELRELRSGKMKAGEQWVPRDPAELRAAGWLLDPDVGWVSPEEQVERRKRWPYAASRSSVHWQLKATVDDDRLGQLEPDLEACYDALRQLLSLDGSRSLRAWVYADWRAFVDHGRSSGRKPAALLARGEVDAAARRLAACEAGLEREQADALLFARAAQLALAVRWSATRGESSQPPAWLVAGIGELFAGHGRDAQGKPWFRRRTDRQRIALRWTTAPRDADLRALLAADAPAADAPTRARLAFRMRSWSLLQALLELDERRFVAWLDGKQPGTLIEAMRRGPGSLEARWRGMIEALVAP